MLTDNQLRDRLYRQIDRLPPGKLRLVEQFLSTLEENEPIDTVMEDTTEYSSGEGTEKVSVVTISDDIPAGLYSQEEFEERLWNKMEEIYGMDLRKL